MTLQLPYYRITMTNIRTNPTDQILEILGAIKGNGNFACSGAVPFVLPGLIVQGKQEELSFPLLEETARELISLSRKAPFGKGAETILDENVRRVWEMDASALQFKNPEWTKMLASMLRKVQSGLGMEKEEIQANLYKLLVYEKGGFFLPHKDSEKEEGMFGTLLINLPSTYIGGELIVRFDGQMQEFDFGGTSPYQFNYTAFYADCEHEVKPVESGYRVCLAYNLIHKKKAYLPPAALSKERIKLAACLKELEQDTDFPKILLLGHQYTPTNFSMDKLKLNDRPRADVFLQAAEEADYYATPMLYSSYQMGELEIEGYHWDYGRHDDPEELSKGTMGEIYEAYTEVNHWMEEDSPHLEHIDAETVSLLRNFELNEGEPIEKETEGFTGNAGMEMEYWYHYGAICFWPKKRHIEIVAQQPLNNQLQWISYYMDEDSKESKRLISDLLDTGLNEAGNEVADFAFNPLVRFLIAGNDTVRLKRLVDFHFSIYFTAIDVNHHLQLLATFYWSGLETLFTKIRNEGQLNEVVHLVQVLKNYHQHESEHAKELRGFLEPFPLVIERLELTKFKGRKEQVQCLLVDILFLSRTLNLPEPWCGDVAKIVLQKLNSSFIEQVVLPVVEQVNEPDNLLEQIIRAQCCEFLEHEVSTQPLPPLNWQRHYPAEMMKQHRYAEQIALLKPFLDSPTEQILEYRRGQTYRSSMTELIAKYQLDLKGETIAKGSPHILKLTKTQAS